MDKDVIYLSRAPPPLEYRVRLLEIENVINIFIRQNVAKVNINMQYKIAD